MLMLIIIALVCGAISIVFIMMEFDESFKNFERNMSKLNGLSYITLPWVLIKSWMPLITDVLITLGVVWLFGMQGMVGMMVSLMASSVISGYLYIRRRRINRQVV